MNPLAIVGLVAGGVTLAALLRSKKSGNAGRSLLADGDRVMLIGDSLAVGLNPKLKNFSTERGVSYIGRGVGGSRIDQWARDLWVDQTISSFKPTLILVSLGTNDAALGPNAVSRQQDSLDRLLGKLHSSNADVVWIGPPTLPFPDNGVSNLIRSKSKIYFPSERYEISRQSDRLHPDDSGYSFWASNIWSWLS